MVKVYEDRIARLYGVTESMIFSHIKYWTDKNRENGRNCHEGKYWMYDTLETFQKAFPFFSQAKIYRALKSLTEHGLILKGNFNKTPFDRTAWYAISDEGMGICSSEKDENCNKSDENAFSADEKSIFHTCKIDIADMKNRFSQNETTIPHIIPQKETEYINQNIIFSEDDENSTRSADNSFSSEAKEILSELGMKREPTRAELILYEKWRTEFLLPHDVILKSCELTGRAAVPSFTYLDRVLNSLREGGVCDMTTYGKYKDRQKRHEDYCAELFAQMGLSQNPTFTQRERIRQFLDEYHLSRDILNLAADRARQNSNPYDYLCRAATSLYERDIISSMSEARDFLDRSSKTQAYSPVKRDGYAMHRYTAEELAHIGVDLDDDSI